MRISTLLGRPVVLLGAGREGLATFRLLRARGYAAPIRVLADQPAQGLPDGLVSVDGADLDTVLTPATVVVRSPGFAPHHRLRRRLDAWGGHQTTATHLLLAELQAADISTIGVTASKGKSTIATLIHELLLAAGRRAALVGNIGVPGLSRLDGILAERPIVVLELSSYQCADLAPGEGPALVVFGSLFPEHLDWHGTLHDYLAAKASLLSAAPAGACLMVHRPSGGVLADHALAAALMRPDVTLEWVNDADGLHVDAQGFADGAARLCSSRQMRLPGRHNRENACLAFAAARRCGAGVEALRQVLAKFTGLPFRLQEEGVHGGIRWINDSISTAPEAACAALEAFQGEVHTLIAGGQDRGYDYAPLAAALLAWQVRHVVVLPESGPALARCVAGTGSSASLHAVGNLSDAVAVAARVTSTGSVCLFSPAAPSYHAWSGFEARGEDFRRLIRALV